MLDDVKNLVDLGGSGGDGDGAFGLHHRRGNASLGAGDRCSLAHFLEFLGWRFSWSSCGTAALEHILLSLTCRSVEVTGCWWASEEESARITQVPNLMTRCCNSHRTFICVSNWWLTCVTASRSRSSVSRWITTSSYSRSAFALCSSNCHHRSITILTSCPRVIKWPLHVIIECVG